MEKGKEFYYVSIGSVLIDEHEAVGTNAHPMRDTVVAHPVDLVLRSQVGYQTLLIKDPTMFHRRQLIQKLKWMIDSAPATFAKTNY